MGLMYVLASAVFFALSTVRLGRYSSRFNPLKLSTASTCSLGLLSIAWVVSSVIGGCEIMDCGHKLLPEPLSACQPHLPVSCPQAHKIYKMG